MVSLEEDLSPVGTTGTAGPRNLMPVIFLSLFGRPEPIEEDDERQFVPWTRRTRRTDQGFSQQL
jgi:hypothetical protein